MALNLAQGTVFVCHLYAFFSSIVKKLQNEAKLNLETYCLQENRKAMFPSNLSLYYNITY